MSVDKAIRKYEILKLIETSDKKGRRFNELYLAVLRNGKTISPRTLSNYLKELEREGYITTRIIDERRNYVTYIITEKGIEELITVAGDLLKMANFLLKGIKNER